MPTTPQDFSSTPTALPSAPREFHVTTKFSGLWYNRLFILPFMVAAISLPFYLSFIMLASTFYTPTPAQVTGANEHSGKGGPNFSLSYHYVIGGNDYTDSSYVSRETYDHYRMIARVAPADRTVTANFFKLGPFHHSSLTLSQSEWPFLLFMSAWTTICIFISANTFKMFWLVPFHVRNLYRNGAIATGIITRKYEKAYKNGPSHYLEFIYELPDKIKKKQTSALVWNKTAWQNAKEGEAVTILYNPRRPNSAVVYEYGDYEIDFPKKSATPPTF